jgi:hypothetical protein
MCGAVGGARGNGGNTNASQRSMMKPARSIALRVSRLP